MINLAVLSCCLDCEHCRCGLKSGAQTSLARHAGVCNHPSRIAAIGVNPEAPPPLHCPMRRDVDPELTEAEIALGITVGLKLRALAAKLAHVEERALRRETRLQATIQRLRTKEPT